MGYLLKPRFVKVQNKIIKLIEVFVTKLGKEVLTAGGESLLTGLASIEVVRSNYNTWTACLGQFLKQFKCPTFF